MDQRSDYIRQDIESTRAALDEKLDTLETKARQTFDLKHQVSERPWMMLGAAVAAGYVLGSLGGNDREWYDQSMSTDYNQYSGTPRQVQHTATSYTSQSGYPTREQRSQPSGESFLSQFDDEIDMLKTAAISTLTSFLRDTIREYVPSLGQQIDVEARKRGGTPSSAPNTSMPSGASANYEGIPETTSYGSNVVSRDSAQGQPYYPPGSSSTTDRDYVKTYHPPSETDRERTVGDETKRY
jgi:hypothetical protein